jgi:hypothetical protein
MHGVDIETAAGDQPGDQRVRVPHLACPELVASPDRRRHLGHQLENAPRESRVVRQPLWALDRLVDVRDHAAAPAPDLVAEDAERARPAAADRSFGDDAAPGTVAVADGCHLDHEPSLRHPDFERRVVEVAGRSLLEPRRHRLEDAPVQPHRTTARTQREPVEVDAGLHGASMPFVRLARVRTNPHATCGKPAG